MGSRLGPGRNPGMFFDRANIEAEQLRDDGRGGQVPDGHLSLPGTSGNYASTPDSAALSVTGDIDIRARVAMDQWVPDALSALVSKGFNDYGLYVSSSEGKFVFRWHETSGGPLLQEVSGAPDVDDGAVKWVRVTVDVDDGAGNRVTTFYTSDDGATWTQIDQNVTAGTTQIRDTTASLDIGAKQDAEHAAGKLYRAQIYDGIDGTLALDADFTEGPDGATSITEDANGATVTVNQDGADPAEIVGDWSAITGGSGIPVDIRELEGEERIRAMQAQSDVTHEVTTSIYVDGVKAGHRLKVTSDSDRLLYLVGPPIRIGRKRRLKLMCREDVD